MELLGFIKRTAGILCLAGLLMPSGTVWAEEGSGLSKEEEAQTPEYQVYPLVYGEWQGRPEDVIELREEGQEYQVLPGDSLWSISEKLWGEGKWYHRLTLKNGGNNGEISNGWYGSVDGTELKDPNLIYPGMVLQGAQKGYIYRRQMQNAGVEMGDYSMDTPGSWTVGTISSGDAFGNFVFSGDGINKIICLVQDKKTETTATVKDWEACIEKIRVYAEEYYGENVSELCFEHYQTGREDEVYLYSFLWQMELPDHPEAGRVKVRVCMGLKLTEHIQAEFLGFASRYDIHGGVRYTTASFEEHIEDYDPETFTVNDSNMAVLPEAKWELEGLYDPFAWQKEFWGSLLERAAGMEEEPEDSRSAVIDRMEKTGGRR